MPNRIADQPTRDLAAGFDLAAWRRRLAVAQRQAPADVVLRGGQVVNVFTSELQHADVALVGDRIAGVGNYPDAYETIDISGHVVAPSFIDGHVHTESSLVWLTEFARAVVPHGTGLVVPDPHEIANVAGLAGMQALRSTIPDLPMGVKLTVPSCVPASPFESPGASLDADKIAEAFMWPESIALGELMNFTGTLAGDAEVAAKLAVANGRRIDGHAPGLMGAGLQAYAGAGPTSDHESSSLNEARAKLEAGLMVMIREGSSERNLRDLLPLVTDNTYPRICFCSDDRDCQTLLRIGHVDEILRKAIAAGLDPIRAIRMATWNTAEYWRLDGQGAVAPGYRADLVVLSDLHQVTVRMTLYGGRIVAEDGNVTVEIPSAAQAAPNLRHTVHLAPVTTQDLRLDPRDATQAVQVVPGQIVTKLAKVLPTIIDDWAVADVEKDLLKLVCVERHHASGRIGVGYIRGFGLKSGALASTIAHDAHNIIAVGVSDADILGAIAVVAESQGGLAAVANGQVLGHLPLPIAGILSDQPLADVATAYEALEATARSLGSSLDSPFGTLAFMALSVIPEARVTDHGFLHVE
jgi:adenine deaminase